LQTWVAIIAERVNRMDVKATADVVPADVTA